MDANKGEEMINIIKKFIGIAFLILSYGFPIALLLLSKSKPVIFIGIPVVLIGYAIFFFPEFPKTKEKVND